MNEHIPASFSVRGVHRATQECWSCDGEGTVEDYECGLCSGKGSIKVGCGGQVTLDPNHAAIGADCKQCGGTVPTDEITVSP